MAEGNGNDQRHASLEKAGRLLRAARAAGEQDHADMLYDEVARAAKTILDARPKGVLSNDATAAICELIASSILMSSLSTKPPQGWFSKLWGEYRSKSPMTQVSIAVGTMVFLGGLGAGFWVAAPPALRAVASIMDGGVKGEAKAGVDEHASEAGTAAATTTK